MLDKDFKVEQQAKDIVIEVEDDIKRPGYEIWKVIVNKRISSLNSGNTIRFIHESFRTGGQYFGNNYEEELKEIANIALQSKDPYAFIVEVYEAIKSVKYYYYPFEHLELALKDNINGHINVKKEDVNKKERELERERGELDSFLNKVSNTLTKLDTF